MEKLLIYLRILQVKSVKDKRDLLGKRYADVYRFNPYNPLSYITLIIVTLIGIICYGIIGWWDELGNPFKWN
jgi:hypothetical protein